MQIIVLKELQGKKDAEEEEDKEGAMHHRVRVREVYIFTLFTRTLLSKQLLFNFNLIAPVMLPLPVHPLHLLPQAIPPVFNLNIFCLD